jgi:Family of unknown function (DUF6348)
VFWRAKPPAVSASNPGTGHTLRAALSGAEVSWEENVDLVAILHAVLKDLGIESTKRKSWLELPSGFTLYPQFWSFQPNEHGRVQTASTVQVAHPKLVPEGLFEYQHSTGDDLQASFGAGFKSWAELDLATLRDALEAKPKDSMVLSFPNDAQLAGRRVVLGPFIHYVKQAAPENTDHDFCPCCLFTHSHPAFESLLRSDGFAGIRLYAARGTDGIVQADCRVNGDDYAPGRDALLKYAAEWPERGFEFRKQYVVLQTV